MRDRDDTGRFIKKETTVPDKEKTSEKVDEKAEAAVAVNEVEMVDDEPEREPVPYSQNHHADGTDKMLVIERMDGSGQREISADEWERNPAYYKAVPGTWRIVGTHVVTEHHSDAV